MADLSFRRQLRKQATAAEKRLWLRLRRRQLEGRKFRRQHPIGPFIVDFYCAGERMAIELDGSIHDDPLRWAYDEEREAYIQARGIRVLRFRNEDVMGQIEVVLEAIRSCLSDG